jgi:UDP-N-acetylmuramate dehydrogenase
MLTLLKFLRKINIDCSIAVAEPMANHTSLRIGGPADALVAPRNEDGLQRLVVEARREGIPLFFLGGGANILVGDRGIRGIVVELRQLDGISIAALPDGRTGLSAGAGCPVGRLCEVALSRGLAGLENFYGMPGSLGGSVFMNARCYELEMSERLDSVRVYSPSGFVEARKIIPSEWSYKRSPFQPGASAASSIVLGADFVLGPGLPADIARTMLARKADREAKGQFRLPSAGSFFKNDRAIGRPSGIILDELGLRGRRIGDALIAPWHANIFVNAGKASARDMLALVDSAREAVRKQLGFSLEAEVLFVGEP